MNAATHTIAPESFTSHDAVTKATATPRAAWWPWLVVVLGFIFPLLTIWTVTYPPMIDVENHLARHWLESLYLRGAPLPDGYAIHYKLLPNLGADFVIPFLIWFMEPLTALKVFLSLSTFLYWLGPALFIRQRLGPGMASWVASLLLLPYLFNMMFWWGFINFYSGVGLAFLAAVHLRRLTGLTRLTPLEMALHAGFVTLLFFWHLGVIFVYGVLALMIVGEKLFSSSQDRSWRESLWRSVFLLLPMAPAAVLGLIYLKNKPADAVMGYDWGYLSRKATLPLMVFRGLDYPTDALALLLWLVAVAAFFRPSWALVRPSWSALWVLSICVLAMAIPFQWRSTYHADTRPLVLLLPCLLVWLGAGGVRSLRLGLVLLVAVLVLHGGMVLYAWHQLDKRLCDVAPAVTRMEPGARVLPVLLLTHLTLEHQEYHFVCTSVFQRGAFVPELFAYADQQPLEILRPVPTLEGWDKAARVYTPNVESIMGKYDYVWIYNPKDIELRIPPGWTQEFAAQKVTLWKVAGTGQLSQTAP
jgi:hypothetical protein